MLDIRKLVHDLKETAESIRKLKPSRGRADWTSAMGKELQALRACATRLCGLRARHRGRKHLRLDAASEVAWNAILDEIANDYVTDGEVSQAA